MRFCTKAQEIYEGSRNTLRVKLYAAYCTANNNPCFLVFESNTAVL